MRLRKMLNWFKWKPKCNHDWHETIERKELVFDCVGGTVESEWQLFVYTYCPKCDTRKKLHWEEWEILKKEIEIKRGLNEHI
jgi:hypothetical protein